jgi:hypothetical protein
VRFRGQTRTTALPEEPILLRIYRTNGASAAPAEAAFRLPDAADHSRTIGKSAGREWFLTHTRFLDEIARTLSLHTDIINEGAREYSACRRCDTAAITKTGGTGLSRGSRLRPGSADRRAQPVPTTASSHS